MRNMKMIGILLILLCGFGLTKAGFSEDYPKRTIHIIVAAPAGGGSDLITRAIQVPLEKILGTKILVENVPGGAGKIAATQAMKAKPDGYTLILGGETWIGYYYQKTYDSKVWEAFTPIGNFATEPYTIFELKTESPYKTFADLIKAAKENPGKLNCGVMGVGGMRLIALNDIARAAGIDWKYVPFAGAAPSTVALLGGHIDFRVSTPGEAIAMIRAGKTRGLAVSSDKRMKALPDVPTFKELGIGESLTLSRSFWGPPNLPPKIVNIITKAMEKATKDPDFVKLAEDRLLVEVEYRSPNRLKEEFTLYDKKYGPKLLEAFK